MFRSGQLFSRRRPSPPIRRHFEIDERYQCAASAFPSIKCSSRLSQLARDLVRIYIRGARRGLRTRPHLRAPTAGKLRGDLSPFPPLSLSLTHSLTHSLTSPVQSSHRARSRERTSGAAAPDVNFALWQISRLPDVREAPPSLSPPTLIYGESADLSISIIY